MQKLALLAPAAKRQRQSQGSEYCGKRGGFWHGDCAAFDVDRAALPTPHEALLHAVVDKGHTQSVRIRRAPDDFESPAVQARAMAMDILEFYNKDMYNQ